MNPAEPSSPNPKKRRRLKILKHRLRRSAICAHPPEGGTCADSKVKSCVKYCVKKTGLDAR